MNETIETLLNHKSIRKFKDKKIEPEVLEKLLETAIRAPSGGNLQNYSLILVDEQEKLEYLAEQTYSPFVKNAPLTIISCIDQYRWKKLCDIYDAPFHNTNADSILIGTWDAIIALHNIVIAAESMGLGTCYVGLIISADYRELLNIPDYVFAVGMVVIGYPDQEPELRKRKSKDAIIHRNSYQEFSDDDLKQLYEDYLLNWDRFYNRLTDEKKKHWNDELGVNNNIQYVTKTVYTAERVKEWGEKAASNLKKAKFEFK